MKLYFQLSNHLVTSPNLKLSKGHLISSKLISMNPGMIKGAHYNNKSYSYHLGNSKGFSKSVIGRDMNAKYTSSLLAS